MADVKKINFDNGDEYEIKDATAREQIEELNETLTEELANFVPTKPYLATSTVEEMIADWAALPNQTPGLFATYGDTSQFLTNNLHTNALWIGIRIRNDTMFDYVIFSVLLGYIYVGRTNSDSELVRLRRIALETVDVSN